MAVTRVSWALSLLQAAKCPTTSQNVKIIVAWETAEGGAGPQFGVANNQANFNPLNTTQTSQGATSVNSAGVKSYGSWEQGLNATVQTLANGHYGAILALLQTGTATSDQAAAAVDNSVWGTTGLTAAMIDGSPGMDDGGTQVAATSIPGTVFGAGGTGTPGNQASASLWTVGDPSNPDQDYWTTINQYGTSAQWYVFSDAETLFVADGIELMAQQPQAIISRLDPKVVHAECTYDNTAFQYTHTHTKKGRIQRRTSLAKLTSPTQVSVQIICDIDHFRAGDTVYLKLFGPADGVWLIGDCTRSIYEPFSSLTLVQAMQPINASSGLAGGPAFLTGKQASQATAGTVIAAMISEATTISNDDYPYVWAGGHGAAGTPSVGSPGLGFDGHTVGFDCSGAVAAVLAAGGLWQAGSSVGNDASVIQTLLSQNKIVPGQGTGSPECTLFDSPDVHIFMRLNGQYFGTSDGGGGNHSQPNGGAGWLNDSHSDVATFRAYHVPQAILGQQAGG